MSITVIESSNWDDYGDFLLEVLGFTRSNYSNLLRLLHYKPFYCYLEEDNGRLEDGILLREDYFEEVESIFPPGGVSILEVLIALSFRMENEFVGDPGEPNPEHVFWDLICNLGLQRFHDDLFKGRNRSAYEHQIHYILDKWMCRNFDMMGNGSIFPIRKTKCGDQRLHSIWSQMMVYIQDRKEKWE